MAIQQRADDAAAEYTGECFVVFVRMPLRDYFITHDETADMQTVGIGRTTTETSIVWREGILK